MQRLFERQVVSYCTTQHLEQIPQPDNQPDGVRLSMAAFSAVYMGCLVSRYAETVS